MPNSLTVLQELDLLAKLTGFDQSQMQHVIFGDGEVLTPHTGLTYANAVILARYTVPEESCLLITDINIDGVAADGAGLPVANLRSSENYPKDTALWFEAAARALTPIWSVVDPGVPRLTGAYKVLNCGSLFWLAGPGELIHLRVWFSNAGPDYLFNARVSGYLLPVGCVQKLQPMTTSVGLRFGAPLL